VTVATTRLKYLCVDGGQYGLNLPASEYVSSGEGLRLIRTTDLRPDGLLPPDEGIFAPTPVDARFLLDAGDVLVSRAGTIGRSFLTPPQAAGSTFAGFLVRFRPQTGTDSRYLNYVLQSTPVQQQIQAEAITSTIQNFNAERYASLRVPNVDPEQQRRTADFLDEQVGLADKAIKLRRREEALLADRRSATVLQAVTGAERSGPRTSRRLTWARSTPADWPVSKITYHSRLGSGHTPSRSRPEWWTDCTIPWITTGEVHQIRDDRQEVISSTREHICTLGVQNSSAEVHPAGTVVLSRTASAGFSGVMGSNMATSQDFVTWTCQESLDPFYLLWCLRAMRRDLLGRLAMGSTHKTIYVPDIQTLRIPVPPIIEQARIVKEIRDGNTYLDRLVDLGRTQVALLNERKQALITAAVTGEFDVTTARTVA